MPGGCQTVTSRTKLSLLRSMLSLQLAQPRHMEGEKRHTEKVMKFILFNRYKKTASPSLCLTSELYIRNYSSSFKTQNIFLTPHQIIELTIFFAPYLLRHLTSDKRNVVTDYDVSVGGARGSKNISATATRVLTRSRYGRFNFWSSSVHTIFSVKEFMGFLGKKFQNHDISLH